MEEDEFGDDQSEAVEVVNQQPQQQQHPPPPAAPAAVLRGQTTVLNFFRRATNVVVIGSVSGADQQQRGRGRVNHNLAGQWKRATCCGVGWRAVFFAAKQQLELRK